MKRSTLVSVESLIPLLADNIILKADQLSVPELILPWKRRSRVRRILQRLRSIKRTNSSLFDYYRIDQDIYVVMATDSRVLLFLLAWPADLPQWSRLGPDLGRA